MEILQTYLPVTVLAILLWLCIQDMRDGLLPNIGTYPLAALAIVYAYASGETEGLLLSVAAGLYISIGFLILRFLGFRYLGKREPLGLGDVKLVFGIGTFIGLTGLGEWIVLSGLVGLAWVLVQSRIQKRPIHRTRIVFGPALIISGIVVFSLRMAAI